jgi:hypothetical protein
MNRWLLFILPWVALGMSACASRQPVPVLPPPDLKPLGSVWIDAARGELVISGYVNQVEGAIELLACGPGGKTHESIFVLQADARDLHAGLLLLGLRHGDPMPGLGEGPPEGDRVLIDITWNENGRVITRDAAWFIYDYVTRKPARHGGWVFNGSKIENNYFLALAEESLIATYWDPWAIINIAAPLGVDDERLAVNRKRILPLHTPVRMTIRAEQR